MKDADRRDGRDSSEELEKLMAQARRVVGRQRTSSSSTEQPLARSLRDLGEHLSYFRRLFSSTREVVAGLHGHIVAPVWRVVRPPLLYLGSSYKRIWDRCAYRIDRQTNQRVLSRTRSTVVVSVTVLALSVLTDTRLGEAVRFVTVEPIVDAILIGCSKRTETFYLAQSNEIDPDNNIHSVRGCRRRGVCAESDAAYFRVQPRLSHDIWKLVEYGNPMYVPDHIVAPIAPGLNECEVTYYGYRMSSSWIARVLRSLQFYPTMLEAKCRYIGGDS